MEQLYGHCGISRQNFHQRWRKQCATNEMMIEISDKVRNYRQVKDRRAGSRSLYYNLDVKSQYGIGVTKFEQLMSDYGLTLAPMRVRVVTTKSSLQSWNYKNHVSGLMISNINELVVGDITYIQIAESTFYMFSLIDVYSARIVGYCLSRRMTAQQAKEAFDMWLKLRGKDSLRGCIHHTDGGTQYFSKLYLDALNSCSITISRAENCLENGYAEQRNGLIKHHLIPTISYRSQVALDNEIRRIMNVYNHERKQEKLGWMTPVAFEQKWANHPQRLQKTLYHHPGKPP